MLDPCGQILLATVIGYLLTHRRSGSQQVPINAEEARSRPQRSAQIPQPRWYARFGPIVVDLAGLNRQQPGQVEQPRITGRQLRPRRGYGGQTGSRVVPVVVRLIVGVQAQDDFAVRAESAVITAWSGTSAVSSDGALCASSTCMPA